MIATPPVDYPQRGYVQISGRGTPTNKPASAHCVDGRQVQRIIRQSPETLDVYPYAVVYGGNAGRTPRRSRSASSRSAHERTVPRSMTSPPLASTVIRLGGSSAGRGHASSLFSLLLPGR